MFYTLISGLALILNLIVNRGAFQNVKVQEGVPMERQLPRIRYSVFVLASGMADFLPGYDTVVSEIFERADKEMYENKQKLKEEERSLAG